MNTAVTAAAAAAIVIANLFAPNLPVPLNLDIPAIVAVEKNPYAQLYYYEADKQARYEAYQALHADLSADEVVCLAPRYFNGCMMIRNRHMVDASSAVIAYLTEVNSGSAATVKYASRKNVPVINIAEKLK